ncbi:uncharacterized protein BJ171DRAFT_526784 [Polychytrium aggregatum]|uniref:uncharacterized protein n=1 Tax=Polychytrium aggregatum TaxID=110093 RepID=UPI0022FF3367|nr:uncharacterized protein BJ171DRAFT_526784 [Polychytrium aggregatum]KAI9193482.1 hypothetical protein BJ171DRAFT_526784 [Polychytrium aggregatum]
MIALARVPRAFISGRLVRSIATHTPAVTFAAHGSPESVLVPAKIALPELKDDGVQLQFLASPVNPADLNQVQGTYPVKPTFHPGHGAVGGNEGIARVVAVGSQVSSVVPGDLVLPLDGPSHGTWRKYANVSSDKVLKVDLGKASIVAGATVTVNPCTAYRMLKDFVSLQPGDVVVQNGATSSVGQAVIQLAKAWGIQTVNVIRPRPDFDRVESDLRDLGATLVLSEDDVRKPETLRKVQQLGPRLPQLALNCVGGKSATNLVRLLGDNGIMVTYGGMSKEPLTFPTSPFIFKNFTAAGFWMTRWYQQNSIEQRKSMVDELLQLTSEGRFKDPWHQLVRLTGDAADDRLSIAAALQNSSKQGAGKQIIVYE